MIKQWDIDLPDEGASLYLAKKLGTLMRPPLTLTFKGEIGAGKTTLIRAMLRAAGITARIKSPTYALIETYDGHLGPIHHFDLYRIVAQDELDFLGFREYFAQNTICCIEWPEQAGGMLTRVDVAFSLSPKAHGRALQIQAYTVLGEGFMTQVLG